MTVSALLAGRLIVGCKDSGTCGKHKRALITKWATGQVMRKKKQVADSFHAIEKFRAMMMKFATFYGHEAEINIQTISTFPPQHQIRHFSPNLVSPLQIPNT